MSRVVAIHQPNFFPWLGFFDKILKSDVFVLLDHVQFQKTGGTWTNRVKLLVNHEGHWVTAPIVRNYHGVRAINEMELRADPEWANSVMKTLVQSYSKAAFFRETFDFFEPLIRNSEPMLSKFNIHAIRAIVKQLGIRMEKLCCSSDLSREGSSNEMLISLTKTVGGDTYMCGGGADGYQDPVAFQKNGINLLPQNFKHPHYSQIGAPEFVPGLSIIDAAMNVGWSGVQALLVNK